jgi:dinuclear metal center YbgI/SA1388 family protein
MSVELEIIDSYLSSILQDCPDDKSWNGMQVTGKSPIQHVYGAVDASEKLFQEVHPSAPSLFIVHHGLFWKGMNPSLQGVHFQKIQNLIQSRSALYASHLPLDIHPEIGNNMALLRFLCPVEETVHSLCTYSGYDMGTVASLCNGISLEILQKKYENLLKEPTTLLPFGGNQVRKVAICSGDGASFIADAYREKVDVFITGEFSHTMYIFAQDHHMNVLCLTHYASEKGGVLNVCKKLHEVFSLPFTFIDFSPLFENTIREDSYAT